MIKIDKMRTATLFALSLPVVACMFHLILEDRDTTSFFLMLSLTTSVAILLAIFRSYRKNKTILNEYKTAVDVGNIVSRADTKGNITYVNDEFCTVSGYTREELIGKPHNIVRHPNMPSAVFKELWETISAKKIWRGMIENRCKNGDSYFVDAVIVPIVSPSGRIIEFLGIRHNITEFVQNKQRLYTNILTGLPNRFKLVLDLQSSNNGALAIVNIDQFKIINDFYGNDIGDFVLKEFANRLFKIFTQKHMSVYKMPSDEYAIFSHVPEDRFKEIVTSGIYLACKDSMTNNEMDVTISVTVGMSFGAQSLLEHANMALDFARKHKKHYAVYNESMLLDKNYKQNIEISKTIRDAIENDWFETYFQPIVDSDSGEIKKYETLVRLIKPNGEVLSPYVFLEIAKAAKLYPAITRIVISRAFEKFKTRKESFSINISVEDILDSETRYFIFAMLDSYGIGNRVIFELLESEGIENYSEVSAFLNEVRKRGVTVAIDDFGTGYSNFEHLAKLNVDIIKIDGSLIKNINTDKNATVIAQTIVNFAQKLGIKTVAEFVHSKEVYDTIKDIGVDYAQGYYLGEPNKL